MELNNIAQEMINTFAKTNKVSKAKLSDLVQQVIAAQPIQKKVKNVDGRKGRKTTSKIAQIESELKSSKTAFTVKAVAEKYDVPYNTVFHMVKRLEKKNVFVASGQQTNDIRGKKAVLWMSK